jgi:hypothetical protein
LPKSIEDVANPASGSCPPQAKGGLRRASRKRVVARELNGRALLRVATAACS